MLKFQPVRVDNTQLNSWKGDILGVVDYSKMDPNRIE